MEFDPAKNTRNLIEHGLLFEQASRLDWKEAVTKPDNRVDYGEPRYITYAPLLSLAGRICVLVWTQRGEGCLRPISFRKANARERKRYEEDKAHRD